MHTKLISKVTNRSFTLTLFFVISLSILWGCTGQTKPYIPNPIQPILQDRARIIVTRERQIAGAATPIFIVDVGQAIESNAAAFVRVGNFIKEKGLRLWYSPIGEISVIPSENYRFEESEQQLDDLISNNSNAEIYVDYLRCDPDKIRSLFCGDAKSRCDEPFKKGLASTQGYIMGDKVKYSKLKKNGKEVLKVEVIGKIGVGDTVKWERKPGIMRIGAL